MNHSDRRPYETSTKSRHRKEISSRAMAFNFIYFSVHEDRIFGVNSVENFLNR